MEAKTAYGKGTEEKREFHYTTSEHLRPLELK